MTRARSRQPQCALGRPEDGDQLLPLSADLVGVAKEPYLAGEWGRDAASPGGKKRRPVARSETPVRSR